MVDNDTTAGDDEPSADARTDGGTDGGLDLSRRTVLKGVGAAGVAGSGLTGSASAASVGNGGYHDSPPSGAATHSYGRHTTANFGGGPVPTNDWYTTIPLEGITGSETLLAGHPLNFKTLGEGLAIGHPQEWTTSWNSGDQVGNAMKSDATQLTVSHSGAGTYSDVRLDDHGDWSATGLFGEGTGTSTRFTIAQGSPFAFFEFSGGGGEVSLSSAPSVFHDAGNVVGVAVDGKNYGLFAPSGSTWSGVGSQTMTTGADFVSVAVLPDQGSIGTFEDYAYNQITDTVFDWNYDEANANVTTTFSFSLNERADSAASGTITALYPHQWKHSSEPTMGLTYPSARGEMQAVSGSSFSVNYDWHGFVPFLPDEGTYDNATLEGLVSNVSESIQGGVDQDTYRFGKDTASRMAKSAAMADQLGMTGKRDALLDSVRQGLEQWFTQSSSATFYYDDSIGVLQGIQGSHGSVTDVSDHHFHFGHYVWGAARIARHDPNWAAQDNWGGMVEELIADYANPSRNDPNYPFNRNFSVYAGHSWAHGSGNFADGNNQESSSEAMMAYSAMIEWGEYTGNTEIRDFGIALYAMQARAIQEYWYDKDQTNFPDSWEADFAGIVWGNMAAHSTWWTADSEAVYGINMLPLSGYSMHLGWDDNLTDRTFQQISDLKGGSFSYWPDILWMYRAFSDPADAYSRYNANAGSYSPEAAQPQAHTLYWIGNLDAMGSPDPSVTADTPLYQVFSDGSERTYCAYNASDTSTTVNFSDGTTLTVPANSLATSTGSDGGGGTPSAPSNLHSTDQTTSSISLAWDHDGTNTAYYNVYRDGAFETTSSSTSATITDLSADTSYTFHVTADDGNGNQSPDSNSVTVSTESDGGGGGGQQPYPGSPHPVPGRIQAQEYDTGGEGVAYHDTNASNDGGAFRTDEGVDIEAASDSTGGEYNVCWVRSGEWIEYTVDVAESGTYDLHIRTASDLGGGTMRFLFDGQDVTGTVDTPATGGWQSWTTVTVQDIELSAGEQVMRVEFEADDFNHNWFELEQVDDGGDGGDGTWSNQDVGSVSTAGSTSTSDGTRTVEGAGADIWGSADEFHYVFQEVSGDVTVTANVTSVENTHGWAKAGVMIRESLDAGSVHGMSCVTPGNGTAFQRRTSTGGTSANTGGSGSSGSYWVRIERSGDTITAYESGDGSSWSQIGSETIAMSDSVYVGLPVTSHASGTLCTATFENVAVDTGGGGGGGGGGGDYSGTTGDGWSASVSSVGTDQVEWTFEPNSSASWADIHFADPGSDAWVGYRMNGSGTEHTHTRDTSGDGSSIDFRFVYDDGAGGQYVSERRTHQY